MPALELTRSPEDRKLYVLPGVGELRVARWPRREVEARAGGQTYTFARRRARKRMYVATDAAGNEAGTFRPRIDRREAHGGTIVWRTTEWDLRADGEQIERFALARPGGEEQLATIELGLWGKRPVRVDIDDAAGLDPGLVLFAVFAMRLVTEQMNNAALSYGGSGGGAGS